MLPVKETKNAVKALYSLLARLDNFQHGSDLLVQNIICLNQVHSFSFKFFFFFTFPGDPHFSGGELKLARVLGTRLG